MKRVMITGASGFVGANLARRVLHDGYDVHLLVRPQHSPWRIEDIRPHVHLHEVAFEDKGSLQQVVRNIKPDWVFHLAAHGAYSWQTDLQQMVKTNILGTMNLLESCVDIGFEAFVNTGSSSEYGYKDHAPSETESLEPNSHYAVTKASATMFCLYTAQTRGVRISTLRLYSAYGPFEDPMRLIPSLIVRGLIGQLPPLSSPDIARDYVYVSDVVEAYMLAATVENQDLGAIYNVGTGVQTPLRDVVELTRGLLNIRTEPVWGSMPNRKWDTNIWIADNTRIKQELGWQPKCTMESGLSQTLSWFTENPMFMQFYGQQVNHA